MAVQADPATITFRVDEMLRPNRNSESDNFNEFEHTMGVDAPMSSLITYCASRIGIERDRIVLVFDGRHIQEHDTARKIELEENDVIQTFIKFR